MAAKLRIILLLLFPIVFVSLKLKQTPAIGVDRALALFSVGSVRFASSASDLKTWIEGIQPDGSISIRRAREALQSCRIAYKGIEYFMEYFLRTNAVFYNGPPKFEVEEPYMEWQTPTGLQVIESLLYDDQVFLKKDELLSEADALLSSSQDINALIYNFKGTDEQVLESVNLELIRIYTLGITGFDAPSLKSGIVESFAALQSLDSVLAPYLQQDWPGADSVKARLHAASGFLLSSKDFDSFDRLEFLVGFGLPLQECLQQFTYKAGLQINTTNGPLNYKTKNLFSADALDMSAFPHDSVPVTPSLLELGKRLFHDPALSGNNKVSCATCHQPEHHFSENLTKSVAFNGHSSLRRNAPTLLYSGFQYMQFWEGRAGSLEQQIVAVLNDSTEMFASDLQKLTSNSIYTRLIEDNFKTEGLNVPDHQNVATAIAAYVRTLNPRNSRFDRFVQGDTRALTPSQKNGFNLFMGKAQCGTCHFAPLFNGLVPPLYNRTELEVLGMTLTDNFVTPIADTDPGRFEIFPVKFYKKAFKTPTVRNASATSPYMHNGSLKTLETVIDFYNKGGGKGLGSNVENQTLSASPLNLTPAEVGDIVNFIHSLEDSITGQF